ncbi:hypothetical protein [Pyxidicoccus sp. MSG2]|uniref:hypothetical protein n=1 Tax=Pyxidicoccus sp. MSG2 TaxID=2996790 RepID=UPI00226F516D|nr:hypothetical protein [Pyxidicoccus sp. MSG2]MCY1018692.1 hypothetical protein [Pyxidicoccus sp. MSG2]
MELWGSSRLEAELFTELCELKDLTRVDIVDAAPRMVREFAASFLARCLERFTARSLDDWSLEALPPTETVEAELRSERQVETLAEAIRAATGFGSRVLRIHVEVLLGDEGRRLLERAGAVYVQVAWS